MTLYGNESNETIMKELGQRLQDIRIAMNLTQTEMAERLGAGTCPNGNSRYGKEKKAGHCGEKESR